MKTDIDNKEFVLRLALKNGLENCLFTKIIIIDSFSCVIYSYLHLRSTMMTLNQVSDILRF